MIKVAICMPIYGPLNVKVHASICDVIGRAPDHGIEIVGPEGSKQPFHETTMATDRNRNQIVRRVLKTDAEWTFWWDSDNINPLNTLEKMLHVAVNGKKMIVGLYVHKDKKAEPVAFMRMPDGRYKSIDRWRKGEIIPIDMAGMNSALIHRSVYEEIDKQMVVFQMQEGGNIAVRRDRIVGSVLDNEVHPDDEKLVNGVLHTRVYETPKPVEVPFFVLKDSRTEDGYFFERAAECGFQLFLDTGIICGHITDKVMTDDDFWQNKKEVKESNGQEI